MLKQKPQTLQNNQDSEGLEFIKVPDKDRRENENIWREW